MTKTSPRQHRGACAAKGIPSSHGLSPATAADRPLPHRFPVLHHACARAGEAMSGVLSGTLAATLATLLIAACSPLPPQPGAPSGEAPAADSAPIAAAPADSAEDGTEPGPEAGESDEATLAALPAVEMDPQLMYQLLAAEIAAQRGAGADAAATFLTLARQTRDPRLARRATELYLSVHALEDATRAARLWHELVPDGSLPSRTLAALFLSTGRLDEAEPLLRGHLAQAAGADERAAVWESIARELMRAPDRTAAFSLLERLAAGDAGNVAARLALANMAHASGDDARASDEAQAALELDPKNARAALLVARHLTAGTDGAERAADLLRRFLEHSPKNLEVRFALARILATGDEPAAAREQFEILLGQAPDNPAILLSLAQLSWQMKQPEEAESQLRRYLALPDSVVRDNTPAWLFMGQLAEEAGRTQEAIDWYARVDHGEQFVPALTRRALLTARSGHLEQARALLRTAVAPDARTRARLSAAEALILRETGHPQEAFEVLTRALQRAPENIELLYDHAMAAERIEHLDAMEKSLRRIMSLRPDFAHAYNALGYSLADRGQRLEEAQELIEKALSLQPDNAQILDSMGWVLFRRGRIDAAIEQLEKAWALEPEAEIGAHLGEALWQAGRLDEAREIWDRAARDEPDNRVLNETRARLRSDP